ncbi:flagellar assembly protein FliH [Lysobacter xinjiangensis]|jgi:flagellar assembly protein FliH|uniref:Flagellar assembly protein FliH n=1 Tax=Cognatilysobacter xinjiangensis TaxID=546892 RepID=A0ABQ3BP34_9GAMM|nr:FliH/SctL family protein [Lysobacter xinjiangensis]GGZ52794.1 flagellar assembly protein FliH [Lysobacter xinjiangensis]
MSEAAVLRWIAPGFEPLPPAEPMPQPPSVEELQAITDAAYQDGFQRGHADGFASGQAEVRRMAAQIEGILDSFTRPLARLDGEVADALADLATRIAGTLVGQAYRADPTLLADLVRDALDAVGTSTRDVELRLHPDDLGLLMPHLMTLDGVRLTGDTTLARGELRLHSEGMRIDGTLDARLKACLNAILDGSKSAA